MTTIFKAAFFKNNRRQIQKQLNDKMPIVLTANGLLQRSCDTTFPFRQDSYFWYLTGIYEPDVILVVDDQRQFLIVPERDGIRQAFDGAIDTRQLASQSGIEEVIAGQAGWDELARIIKSASQVATLDAPRSYIDQQGFYPNPARRRLVSRLKKINSELKLVDLRLPLAGLRMIKQPEEIAALKKSINTTIEAFEHIYNHRSDFTYEYEVDAALTQYFMRHNMRHAYDSIVASGGNACILHYNDNAQKMNQSDLLLIDAGAEYSYYAADITRTFSLAQPSDRQRLVIEAVIEVQDYALSLLKPGLTMREYEQKVEAKMGQALRRLGLIAESTRQAIRQYYPHATSHFLGLDVHDVGDYSQPFQPGMVMTVEPGIYIPNENIGVRIEDNVLITKDGVEVLSQRLPRSLD